MANGPSLLETEQTLFDDTDGGTNGTQLADAYLRIVPQVFKDAVNKIQSTDDLEAAKRGENQNE
jgi:hypothetical protein